MKIRIKQPTTVTHTKINIEPLMSQYIVNAFFMTAYSFLICLLHTTELFGIKSNLLLYLLYCAEACIKLAVPISASLCPGNTALFEKMLQRWRAAGNTVSDLTSLRFEPQPFAPETNALLLQQRANLL